MFRLCQFSSLVLSVTFSWLLSADETFAGCFGRCHHVSHYSAVYYPASAPVQYYASAPVQYYAPAAAPVYTPIAAPVYAPAAAPMQYAAAPVSYAPTNQDAMQAAQNLGISEILSIVDRLGGIADRLDDRDGGSTGGTSSSWSALERRVEKLDLSVRKNMGDIAEVIATQEGLANRIDEELAELRESIASGGGGAPATQPENECEELVNSIKANEEAIKALEPVVQKLELHFAALSEFAAAQPSEEATEALSDAKSRLKEEQDELNKLKKTRESLNDKLQALLGRS